MVAEGGLAVAARYGHGLDLTATATWGAGSQAEGSGAQRGGTSGTMGGSAAAGKGRGEGSTQLGGSAAATVLRRARSRGREGEGGRERHRCDPHLVAKLGQVFLSTETEETKIDDDGTSAPRLWRRRCVLWGCFGGSELRLGFVGRAAAGGCYL